MRVQICGALLAAATGLPAGAQSEDALKRALEGQYVRVQKDLPATSKGVDLRFDKSEPFKPSEHFDRIRDYDVAVREGDQAQISKIKVKDDMIEFHLEGGGFNWILDTTTRSFVSSSKTSHEKDLERDIKNEQDPDQRRHLQRDLDRLRRDREREDNYKRREVEDYNREAHRRDIDRALRSGSRINLRFKKNVPYDALTAEGIFKYLEGWVVPDSGRRRDR